MTEPLDPCAPYVDPATGRLLEVGRFVRHLKARQQRRKERGPKRPARGRPPTDVKSPPPASAG